MAIKNIHAAAAAAVVICSAVLVYCAKQKAFTELINEKTVTYDCTYEELSGESDSIYEDDEEQEDGGSSDFDHSFLWQTAYERILTGDTLSTADFTYSLAELTGDSYPELIVCVNTSEDSSDFYIYSYMDATYLTELGIYTTSALYFCQETNSIRTADISEETESGEIISFTNQEKVTVCRYSGNAADEEGNYPEDGYYSIDGSEIPQKKYNSEISEGFSLYEGEYSADTNIRYVVFEK